MYLLYLDESGTHVGSPVFIVSGIAIHENDIWYLQNILHNLVKNSIPQSADPTNFELHASELHKTDRHLQGRPAGRGQKGRGRDRP